MENKDIPKEFVDKLQMAAYGKSNDFTIAGENVVTSTHDLKFDNGKLLANILFEDFPDALTAVMEIATFGAKKYARNSWKTVSNARTRYADALVRHQLAMGRGEVVDPESGLLHSAHFAWNALALLQMQLQNMDVRGITTVRWPGSVDITGIVGEPH